MTLNGDASPSLSTESKDQSSQQSVATIYSPQHYPYTHTNIKLTTNVSYAEHKKQENTSSTASTTRESNGEEEQSAPSESDSQP